nr:MAG TPA: hypothetical protein [Caudoviricetes sp.]
MDLLSLFTLRQNHSFPAILFFVLLCFVPYYPLFLKK